MLGFRVLGRKETECLPHETSTVASPVEHAHVPSLTSRIRMTSGNVCSPELLGRAIHSLDTALAVYDGAPCSGGAELNCVDDSCALQTRLNFNAIAGSTYWIRAGNFPGSAPGPGAIEITTDVVDPCGQTTGPDVIVGAIPGSQFWGVDGERAGYSWASTACNVGDMEIEGVEAYLGYDIGGLSTLLGADPYGPYHALLALVHNGQRIAALLRRDDRPARLRRAAGRAHAARSGRAVARARAAMRGRSRRGAEWRRARTETRGRAARGCSSRGNYDVPASERDDSGRRRVTKRLI